MFKKIIGNELIKEMLSTSIENGTPSHSYLFVGVKGIGKKLCAYEFAKQILCQEEKQKKEQEIQQGCSCKSCIEFDSNNHPDFMCIQPDGNSIKIEQIRFLQKKIQEKPILSNKKVYIINDAETMTVEAQNCLLKTLEEPPEFATIILIGSNENAFLTTIKSRCMVLKFMPIEDEKIREYMQKNYGIGELTSNHLSIFQGSIGKAIMLKDKQDEYNQIIELVEKLNEKDLIEIIKMSEILYKSKEEIFEILEYMNILLFEKTKEDYLYTNCIKIVENTKKRLKQNANYDMCIDNMLFNMKEQFEI